MIRLCILIYDLCLTIISSDDVDESARETELSTSSSLSLTEAYTLKVSGKVELGEQLSKLFKELYTQFGDNGVLPADLFGTRTEQDEFGEKINSNRNIEGHDEFYTYDQFNNDKFKRHKPIEKPKEIPVLEKMVKNDLEQLHLYGYHKYDDKNNGKPLNNVNL